jgi:hypothetical protein
MCVFFFKCHFVCLFFLALNYFNKPIFCSNVLKKARKKPKQPFFLKKVRQDLKSQKNSKNAKKCQTTSKTPNPPKFGLEKRHLATLPAMGQSHCETFGCLFGQFSPVQIVKMDCSLFCSVAIRSVIKQGGPLLYVLHLLLNDPCLPGAGAIFRLKKGGQRKTRRAAKDEVDTSCTKLQFKERAAASRSLKCTKGEK